MNIERKRIAKTANKNCRTTSNSVLFAVVFLAAVAFVVAQMRTETQIQSLASVAKKAAQETRAFAVVVVAASVSVLV